MLANSDEPVPEDPEEMFQNFIRALKAAGGGFHNDSLVENKQPETRYYVLGLYAEV